jgi:hypothetical protein
VKARLQTQYKDIADKIILMALESVEYSEDKACKILDIVAQEDLDKSQEETKKRTESQKKVLKKSDAVEKNVSFKDSRYIFQISNYLKNMYIKFFCLQFRSFELNFYKLKMEHFHYFSFSYFFGYF